MDPSAARERVLFGFFLAATADLRAAEALTREVLRDPGGQDLARALEIARSRLRDGTGQETGARPRLPPGLLDRLAVDLAAAEGESFRRAVFLRAAWEELVGPPREVMDLRYREGLPIPVLAARLGRSVQAIELALARARLRLRASVLSKLGAPEERGLASGEADLLVERYLGGAAGAEDVRRLEDLLERDPAGRRAFLLALGEDGILREMVLAGPPPRGTPGVSWSGSFAGKVPVGQGSRKSRVLVAAGILMVLALLLAWFFLGSETERGPSPPPAPRIPPKVPSMPVPPPATPSARPPVPAPPPSLEPPAAPSREKIFHFGIAPWHSAIRFETESPAGPLVGWARAVSGSAALDLEAGRGKIVVSVPVDSLATGADFLDQALKAAFEAAGIRKIEFSSQSVAGPGRGRPGGRWEAAGILTMGGRSGPLVLKDAIVAPVEEEAALKGGLGPGEWIRVSVEVPFRPSEFGLGADPFRGLLEDGADWAVSLDLLGGTVRSAGAERPDRIPGIAGTGAPPPVDPPPGSGKLYRLGRHPAFTLLRAEGSAGIERTEIASRSIWGWLRVDPDNGKARVALQIPPRSFFPASGDLRRWLHGDLPGDPPLRFESAEIFLKDASTWGVRGNLEIFGRTVGLYLEVGMSRLEAGACPAVGLDREGMVLSASFRTGLSELVPSLVRWDRAALPWDVRIEVLAEAEEE